MRVQYVCCKTIHAFQFENLRYYLLKHIVCCKLSSWTTAPWQLVQHIVAFRHVPVVLLQTPAYCYLRQHREFEKYYAIFLPQPAHK